MKKEDKNKQSNSLDQRRQDANREILKLMSAQVEKFPGLRLSQILRNMGVVDEVTNPSFGKEESPHVPFYVWVNEFYTEPWVILDRIKNKEIASSKIKTEQNRKEKTTISGTNEVVEKLLDDMGNYSDQQDDAT